MQALGLIETLGFTTAVSAADAALKAADVQLVAVERVIGVGGSLSVTLHFSGDVAAVTASVEAGTAEGQRIGSVVSAHVIAKAHSDVTGKILGNYLLSEASIARAADSASAITTTTTTTSAVPTASTVPTVPTVPVDSSASSAPVSSTAPAAAAQSQPSAGEAAKPDQTSKTDGALKPKNTDDSPDSPD
ncbi:BMC domain-containing protein [Paenibacillus sp. FSL R7-0345]|uniref:BMC domain-containing protein n=1 Tax=Paenibacillus sp. FSL R7-0345 TaxID=2954535 RepID=UPI003159D798